MEQIDLVTKVAAAIASDHVFSLVWISCWSGLIWLVPYFAVVACFRSLGPNIVAIMEKTRIIFAVLFSAAMVYFVYVITIKSKEGIACGFVPLLISSFLLWYGRELEKGIKLKVGEHYDIEG